MVTQQPDTGPARAEHIPNWRIAEAIYNASGFDYQNRVTKPTQANIRGHMKGVWGQSDLRNQFVHALVNRIGSIVARNVIWNNPLAEFKKASMSYGDTIEEVATGLLQAKSYNAERDYLEKDIFAQEPLDVQTAFHKINREEYYKLTVNDRVLRRAALNDGELQTFVSQLMAAPMNSNQYDEFLIIMQLLTEYEKLDGFYKIQVPDVAADGSTADDARTALRRMRAAADNLTFLSSRYNAAKMPTFANRDDLVLLTTPEFKAAVDVEALAAAFNISHAEAYGRIIPVPKEQLNIPGAQSIMTTKEFFMITDTLIENRSQPNPVGLYENYFLHHHGIYSVSRFIPAVLFTTHRGDEQIVIEPTVTGVSAITVKPLDEDRNVATVERGERYRVFADVSVEPEGIPYDGVVYSVTGNQSSFTFIDQAGFLHIGGDEKASSIDVTVVTLNAQTREPLDDGFTSTKKLTVTGDLVQFPVYREPTGIVVKGEPVEDFDPATKTYSVAAADVEADDITVTGVSTYQVTDNGDDTFTVKVFTTREDLVYTVTVTA